MGTAVMACEECGKADLNNTAEEVGQCTLEIFLQSEEPGRRHMRKVTTYRYRCSNGHVWEEKYSEPCWCGVKHD